jgi:hypothetical protein
MAEEKSGEKPKRKQLSGAAKRARKQERERKQRRDEDAYTSVGRSWLQQDAYLGAGAQFDENAPAFELPAYGAAPPVMVKVIQGILIALEQGQMQAPSLLWDGMLRDERVAAQLGVRINGLLGQELELEPADESDKALLVQEDCAKSIARMVPTPQAAQFMRYALGLGVGLAQRLTTRTLKSATPTLHTWNVRFMYFDWLLRKWHIVTQNRGDVVIEPEDPEWLLWEPFGPLGFMHGALLRCLAIPFAIRHWSRTWWARHQEVAGSPIRAGILPADRTPRDESIFLSQLSNLAHEAVIRLPQGKDGNHFDMKLIESSGKGWEGFKELLTHADDSIAIGILGQKQSTNGQGGLGTQKDAGEDTLLRIIRGDSQVGDVFREKLLRPWADENHGSADLAPFMGWDIDPPEDLKLKSESLKNFSAALTALTALPASDQHIDIRALCEEYQMPLKEESEVPEADPEEPDAESEPEGAHEEPDGDEGPNPTKPSDSDGDEDDA